MSVFFIKREGNPVWKRVIPKFYYIFALPMKDGCEEMMRRLQSFFLIWLFSVAVCQAHTAEDKCLTSQQSKQRKERAWMVKPSDERRDQAMLTDARMWYRLFNTRPQRLSSANGTSPGKPHGKLSFAIRHQSKPLKAFHDKRRKAGTLPLRLAASSDYYVIALRHIIR